MDEPWWEYVRRRRLALGWSQEDVAQRVGVRAATVSRWERGMWEPTIQAIRDRVREVLGDAGD